MQVDTGHHASGIDSNEGQHCGGRKRLRSRKGEYRPGTGQPSMLRGLSGLGNCTRCILSMASMKTEIHASISWVFPNAVEFDARGACRSCCSGRVECAHTAGG